MDSTPLDRTRDWILGRLGPDEAERVRAEVERDPDLSVFAERLREVVALTEPMRGAPQSRTTFEALERRLEGRGEPRSAQRRTWRARRVAAAALLLVAAAAATLLAWRAARGPGVLILRAIPLEAVASPAPVELPARLAHWRPVVEGRVDWLRDLDEARRVAEASARPLLVFGGLPRCPWCIELHEGAFSDGRVLDTLEDLVPVELDLTRQTPERLQEILASGYPLLEVLADDLTPLHAFSETGYRPDADEMLAHLRIGLRAQGGGEKPAWERVGALVRSHAAALAAEERGELGTASELHLELADEANPRPFVDAGRAGLARLEADARASLLEAHRLATVGDLEAARAHLAQALARHAGSPYATDLQALLEALRHERRPPRLSSPG